MLNVESMGWREWVTLVLIAIVAASNVGEETRARLKLLLFVANKPFSPDLPAKLKKLYEDVVDARDVNPIAPQCALEAGASRENSAAAVRIESDVEPPAPRIPSYPVTKCRALIVLQLLRASMNLLVICTVPLFVLKDKADPVSLILNTLSVLFVLDVDDLCTVFLGERTTDAAVVEHFEVHQIEADAIERHKLNAMVVTMMAVLLVFLGKSMEFEYYGVLFNIIPPYLYFCFLMANLITAHPNAIFLKHEVVWKMDSAKDRRDVVIYSFLNMLTQLPAVGFFFMHYGIVRATHG